MDSKSIKTMELIGAVAVSVLSCMVVGIILMMASENAPLHPVAIFISSMVTATLASIVGVSIVRGDS